MELANALIGPRIKQARTQLHLSQRQIAGNDMTRAVISQYENGKCLPSIAMLSIIANRLGKPIEYFVAESDHTTEAIVLIEESRRDLAARRPDAALEKAKRAVEVSVLCDDKSIEAQARHALGVALRKTRNWQKGYDQLEIALDLFLALQDKKSIVNTYQELAHCCLFIGEYKFAANFYRKVVRMCTELKSLDELRTQALVYLGTSLHRLGRLQEALGSYEEARRGAQILNNPILELEACTGSGLELYELGRLDEAFHITQQTLKLSRLHGNHMGALLIHNLGIIEAARGNWEVSLSHLRQAFKEHGDENNLAEQANVLEDVAAYWIKKGDYEQAEKVYNEALELLDCQDSTFFRGSMYRKLGALYKLKGEIKSANEFYRISVNQFRTIDSAFELARTIEEWQS